jgi:hypothetical protein
MNIRLPDPPVLWEMSWGNSLVSALTAAFAQLQQPQALPRYTIATLPNAKPYDGVLVYVTDGAANKKVAVSDGIRFRYMDGTAV